jgi:hypothetical protein
MVNFEPGTPARRESYFDPAARQQARERAAALLGWGRIML